MNELQTSSCCALCGRPVAVSLYLRVKPWPGRNQEMRVRAAIPRSEHRFFGYWPPESHLVEYLKVEAHKHSLQRWYEENCRGHTLDEIVEAIEQTVPPLPGVPIRIMWNPASNILAYMQAETLEERRRAQLDIQSQVRAVNVYQTADVRRSVLTILQNTVATPQPGVSYPGAPARFPEGLHTAAPLRADPGEELTRLRERNRRFLQQIAANGVKGY